ncbi:MAG: hypothetical protein ACPGD5_04680 [Salibacteraceae bacterium]
MKKLLTLALSVFILCSCTVNNHTSKNTFSKRKYRKGYHFRGFAKNNKAVKGNKFDKKKEKNDSKKESDQYAFNNNDSSAIAGIKTPKNIKNKTKFEASKKQNNKLSPPPFQKGFSNQKRFKSSAFKKVTESEDDEEDKEYQEEINSYKKNIEQAARYERRTFAFGFHSAAFIIGIVILVLLDYPFIALLAGVFLMALIGLFLLNLFKKQKSLKAAERDRKILEDNLDEDEMAPIIEDSKVKKQDHKTAGLTILMHAILFSIGIFLAAGLLFLFY